MKLHGRILPNHQVFVYSYTNQTLERLAKFSYLFYFILFICFLDQPLNTFFYHFID